MSAQGGQTNQPRRRLQHLVAYIGFRACEGVLSLFSLSLCSRLGSTVGFCAYFILPGYRRLALDNLRLAYGKTENTTSLRHLCRRHFQRLGSNLVVSMRATSMTGEAIDQHIEIEGWENLLAARNKNKGVVIALGHLGPWELLTQSATINPPEHKTAAIYQALSNPYLDDRVRALRNRCGQALFDRQDGFFSIMRHLRNGGVLGVLVDQHAGDHGVFTPFFGRLASTTPLPVLLARRTGAPLLVLTLHQVSHARWQVRYSEPMDLPAKAPEADWLAAMHRELEAGILRSPEDWFWVHNRWKTPNPHFLLSAHHRGLALPSHTTKNDLKPFRMLVRSPNWLGDACMAVPAVRAIKQGRPDAHLTILSPANAAPVWRNVPEVDAVIEKLRDDSVFAVARKLRRAEPFDAGILLPNSPRTAIEMRMAKIPRIVGYASSWRKWLIHQQIPAKIHNGPPAHHVEHYLQIAHRIGADCSPHALFDPINIPANQHPHQKPNEITIGICAGAEYGPAKRWPLERFAKTTSLVDASPPHGRQIRWILFGSPAEVALGEELAAKIPGQCNNLAGKTNMDELIAALRQCTLLLSNDTGTMHLAALLGVPTVAIFGSTEPRWTRPLGKQHTVLREHVECSPCFLRQCPLDFRCMKAIEPEMAAKAILAALDQSLPNSPKNAIA